MDKPLHQHLKPLVRNKVSWGLLTEYLAGEKDRLVTQLISCEEQQLKSLQGELKVINRLLSLEDNLLAEERAKRR